MLASTKIKKKNLFQELSNELLSKQTEQWANSTLIHSVLTHECLQQPVTNVCNSRTQEWLHISEFQLGWKRVRCFDEKEQMLPSTWRLLAEAMSIYNLLKKSTITGFYPTINRHFPCLSIFQQILPALARKA